MNMQPYVTKARATGQAAQNDHVALALKALSKPRSTNGKPVPNVQGQGDKENNSMIPYSSGHEYPQETNLPFLKPSIFKVDRLPSTTSNHVPTFPSSANNMLATLNGTSTRSHIHSNHQPAGSGIHSVKSTIVPRSTSVLPTNDLVQTSTLPPQFSIPTKSLWARPQATASPAWNYGWGHGCIPSYDNDGNPTLPGNDEDEKQATTPGNIPVTRNKKPRYSYDSDYRHSAMGDISIGSFSFDSFSFDSISKTPASTRDENLFVSQEPNSPAPVENRTARSSVKTETAIFQPVVSRRRKAYNGSNRAKKSAKEPTPQVFLHATRTSRNSLTTRTTIYEPMSNDVLCEQGSETSNHHGNRAFRTIVSHHHDEYLRTSKKNKGVLTRRIVRIIHDNGGKFIAKNSSGQWEEISDMEAQKKTGQAFRDIAALD